MERCPCCNARLSGAVICPRCQSQLSHVVSSGLRANFLLEQAMTLWFAGEVDLAVLTLTKAISYQNSMHIRIFCHYVMRYYRRKIFILLEQGQYAQAQDCLQLLRGLQPNQSFLLQLQGFISYLQNKQHTTPYGLKHIIP